MDTRIIHVTIVMMGRPGQLAPHSVRFDLACPPHVAIIESQFFEIVAPGCQPVRATPLTGQVINRSDGTTTARMLGDAHTHDFATVVERLSRMPNVSQLQVG